MNLRGEVVTIVNLRSALQLPTIQITRKNRNVIINACGEVIGLLGDRVADVVMADPAEIDPAPCNLRGIDGRYFKGVYKLDSELLVILDVEKVISEVDD